MSPRRRAYAFALAAGSFALIAAYKGFVNDGSIVAGRLAAAALSAVAAALFAYNAFLAFRRAASVDD